MKIDIIFSDDITHDFFFAEAICRTILMARSLQAPLRCSAGQVTGAAVGSGSHLHWAEGAEPAPRPGEQPGAPGTWGTSQWFGAAVAAIHIHWDLLTNGILPLLERSCCSDCKSSPIWIPFLFHKYLVSLCFWKRLPQKGERASGSGWKVWCSQSPCTYHTRALHMRLVGDACWW